MKTLLVAINSRNLHTNLAVRYLYVCCKEESLDVEIYEGNINTHTEDLLSQIYRQNISIYCFSTYIWNITEIIKIADSIRKLNPAAVIVFGGPEATFRSREFIAEEIADYIVQGDGERALPSLLKLLNKKTEKEIFSKEICQIDADAVPFPYSYELSLLPTKDQLLYYETSRGCPFSCSYCLSSSMYNVTYRSLEKVFKELRFFMNNNVPLVKFVDRTWNGNQDRAKKIIAFILDNPTNTRFHFEAAGDLFDTELLALMKKLPNDVVQLEIGIQTANTEALEAACRKTDLEKLKKNVEEIISWGNIHVHLDLIAGLPLENFKSFAKSFDFAFNMKSQMLQLGFLKLLHGSKLRSEEKHYGIVSNIFPPYEVLKTNEISYEELLALKKVEEVLEHYYNSGKNRFAIDYIIQASEMRPFKFFLDFSEFLTRENFFKRKQAPKDSFTFLYKFCHETKRKFCLEIPDEDFQFTLQNFLNPIIEIMRYDWINSAINSPLPTFMQSYYTSENCDIKKYILENTDFDLKDCNWTILSEKSTYYFWKHTNVLYEYVAKIDAAERTDNLILIFNSTKGKKINSKLLDVLICYNFN